MTPQETMTKQLWLTLDTCSETNFYHQQCTLAIFLASPQLGDLT